MAVKEFCRRSQGTAELGRRDMRLQNGGGKSYNVEEDLGYDPLVVHYDRPSICSLRIRIPKSHAPFSLPLLLLAPPPPPVKSDENG